MAASRTIDENTLELVVHVKEMLSVPGTSVVDVVRSVAQLRARGSDPIGGVEIVEYSGVEKEAMTQRENMIETFRSKYSLL